MSTCVKFTELANAFDWASAVGPYENAAYVSRSSGQIWLVSDFDDAGEDPPEDVGDESSYLPVPSKNELDLGRVLALRFAQDRLPESYERVRSFFAKAGAYAQFKHLLDEGGQLDEWYAYELRGTEEALRAWAAQNDIQLTQSPDGEG